MAWTSIAWIYLVIAGLCEIGWPLGLKLSQTTDQKIAWMGFAAVSMIASGLFLWLSQKTIPMGTAYAIWTGIGAVGTFTLGLVLFKEPSTFFRVISVMFIVIGIAGLKLSNP